MAIYIQREDQKKLMVKFTYTAQRVAKIKTMTGGCHWNSKDKYWTIPDTAENLEQLYILFKDEQVILQDTCSLNSNDELYLTQTGKQMEELLILKGYSPETRKAYLGHMKRFILFIGTESREINNQDIRRYLLYLLKNEKSHSYVNQAVSSIKFLSKDVLHRRDLIIDLPRPKKEQKLPDILSQNEVFNSFLDIHLLLTFWKVEQT